jgi:hypothetical protein
VLVCICECVGGVGGCVLVCFFVSVCEGCMCECVCVCHVYVVCMCVVCV